MTGVGFESRIYVQSEADRIAPIYPIVPYLVVTLIPVATMSLEQVVALERAIPLPACLKWLVHGFARTRPEVWAETARLKKDRRGPMLEGEYVSVESRSKVTRTYRGGDLVTRSRQRKGFIEHTTFNDQGSVSTYKREVGTSVVYRLPNGEIGRADGRAAVTETRRWFTRKEWYTNGMLGSLLRPAVIKTDMNGSAMALWYWRGRRHREKFPAEICYSDKGQVTSVAYYRDGELYRKNGPTIMASGDYSWHSKGVLRRFVSRRGVVYRYDQRGRLTSVTENGVTRRPTGRYPDKVEEPDPPSRNRKHQSHLRNVRKEVNPSDRLFRLLNVWCETRVMPSDLEAVAASAGIPRRKWPGMLHGERRRWIRSVI